MNKLFFATIIFAAFPAIGSEQKPIKGEPIREYFGPDQSANNVEEFQPIRHSFGHNHPMSGYYGPGRDDKITPNRQRKNSGDLSKAPSGAVQSLGNSSGRSESK